MTTKRQILACALAFAAGFWLHPALKHPQASSPPSRNLQEVRDEGLVNGSRMQTGQTPAYDETVADRCAHQQAVRMYREGQLRHSTDRELIGCLGGGKVIGENVGYTGTLNEAHQLKLGSKTHYRIIHGSWKHMGTGVQSDGYGVYTVEQFWRPA
jgi:hypothetical protein